MKIITWNINSIRLRSSLISKILEEEEPDILCLQECKSPSEDMPFGVFEPLGYKFFACWGQKSYNGVAFISRIPLENIEKRKFLGSEQARHISARTITGLTIHNFYFPAGGDIPDRNSNEKFAFKLDYIKAVEDYFRALNLSKSILVGDLNIAPEEQDVWDHKKLLKVVSHTPIEVDHLRSLAKSGPWIDVLRKKYPDEKLFSWWSYRAKDWLVSNKGRRLDHIWLTEDLLDKCKSCYILKEVRGWSSPSDHVPVVAELVL